MKECSAPYSSLYVQQNNQQLSDVKTLGGVQVLFIKNMLLLWHPIQMLAQVNYIFVCFYNTEFNESNSRLIF